MGGKIGIFEKSLFVPSNIYSLETCQKRILVSGWLAQKF